MIKLLFRLVKLWFKLVVMLAGMLVSGLGGVLGGVVAGEILTRAGQISAGKDQGHPPATTKARSSLRGGEHGRTRFQG